MTAHVVQIFGFSRVPTVSIKSSSSGVLMVRTRTDSSGLRILLRAGPGGPPGPYAGIYDSAETALQEAFARVKWPQVSRARIAAHERAGDGENPTWKSWRSPAFEQVVIIRP